MSIDYGRDGDCQRNLESVGAELTCLPVVPSPQPNKIPATLWASHRRQSGGEIVDKLVAVILSGL
jgi:hypothetical protein